MNPVSYNLFHIIAYTRQRNKQGITWDFQICSYAIMSRQYLQPHIEDMQKFRLEPVL